MLELRIKWCLQRSTFVEEEDADLAGDELRYAAQADGEVIEAAYRHAREEKEWGR
jgi:hypothetical protein